MLAHTQSMAAALPELAICYCYLLFPSTFYRCFPVFQVWTHQLFTARFNGANLTQQIKGRVAELWCQSCWPQPLANTDESVSYVTYCGCGLPSCKSGKLETTTTPLTDPGIPFGLLPSKTFTDQQQSTQCVQPVHPNGYLDREDVFMLSMWQAP